MITMITERVSIYLSLSKSQGECVKHVGHPQNSSTDFDLCGRSRLPILPDFFIFAALNYFFFCLKLFLVIQHPTIFHIFSTKFNIHPLEEDLKF